MRVRYVLLIVWAAILLTIIIAETNMILDRLQTYETNRLGCIVSKSEIEELGFTKKHR